ncbi:MAG TPA: M20/M25/M40 family metallo-hydrolase [Nocardioidaceae bacterium]|nr:M20/M25/M40 family metallo-hydrolase [Nocardioidaceae bacterium]
MKRTASAVTGSAAIAAAVALSLGMPATAAVPTDTSELRDAVTAEGAFKHIQEFQDIADANGGTRASGTPGYDASADYVAGLLEAAGYEVERQPFDFPFFQELSTPEFALVSPTSRTYVHEDEFITMDYSGSGDVTALVQAVDLVLPPGAAANTSTSGCETADFDAFTAGNIALMQRGTCSFAVKAINAEAAGAVAAIIFNEGQEGRTDVLAGTLGGPDVKIPVIGTSFAIGNALAQLADATVHIATNTASETRSTENVIAQTPGGRSDRVVVAGAHLDSVLEGPGVNDNGTGSATILEIALQMAALDIEPRNQVRFAFWGAEESGLLGSEHYVSELTKREIKDIAVNLNFDMVGSPNYVRFVYDGDGSDTDPAGPTGSGNVESVFTEYFQSVNLSSTPTQFSGRSDYGPFIAVGIPAGGLFTGAEGVKTPEQAEQYGGVAGESYDPCYHSACDSLTPTYDTPELAAVYEALNAEYDLDGNVNMQALDEMSDAAAHATQTFAMTTSAVGGTAKGSGNAKGAAMDFKGSHLQR